MPDFVPRFRAVCCVVLLIGALSLAGILGIGWLWPMLSHGDNVDHAAGTIISPIGPGKNFVLRTASGQLLRFVCGMGCRASLAHLQRHYSEHAHTDVYYIEGANHLLQALDVD
ncbi:MAG TPA: hypothetical protein VF458_14350 [Ktedonobacteraceae bacterium]